MSDKLQELKTRLAEISDLSSAESLLRWDQETYMPPGSAKVRSEQLATLGRLAHELFIRDEIGQLLEDLSGPAAELDPDCDDARLIRVTARDYAKARKLPPELVAELVRTTSAAVPVWAKARQEADFALFAPHLEKIVGLLVQKAEALGYQDRLYDALLDEYEPDMKTAQVEVIFTALKAEIVPLLQAITANLDAVDDAVLHRDFDEGKQWDMGIEVLKFIGFDFERGRQDKSTHPFTTAFSPTDVRLTTRIDRNFLGQSLSGTLHEGGHALYDQGISLALDRTPLCDGASLGVHESQSRMWENLVGRSRAFWRFFFPRLLSVFPDQLADADAETLYRAVNKVRPSYIRVEADEVTYNLHIMLRFELENDILEGRVKIAEVPAAWSAKMETYLGLMPPDDAQGALQDIHWAWGLMGYFPTYSLGNLISAQLFDQARADLPDLEAQIEAGEFAPLLNWLREHVHSHGRKFTPPELVERGTGRPLEAAPFVRYIKDKYKELYGLP
jgi:carboxypeptidase Taq